MSRVEKVPVMIPADKLDNLPNRFYGVAATARLLARKCEDQGDVGDALDLLAYSLESLATDLDVATWPKLERIDELKEATAAFLSDGEAS